jgi:hypothetical protein
MDQSLEDKQLIIEDQATSQNISFETNDETSNQNYTTRKRSFQESLVFSLTDIAKNKEKYASRVFKKKKMTRPMPVYTEGSNPTQILNEIYPGLTFSFDADTSIPSEMKFICQVEIKHIILNEEHHTEIDEANFKVYNFKAYGNSKKESKRNCCYLALSVLFSDSYKLPQSLIIQNEPNISSSFEQRINELNKRIKKLINHQVLKLKTASQLLHELCAKISETAKCVSESGDNLDKKFAFQIENLNNESLVQISSNPNENLVIGYGRFLNYLK